MVNSPDAYLKFNNYWINQFIIGTEEYESDNNGLIDKNVKDVVIPPLHNGLYVTAVGYKAFFLSSIESIYFPFSIKIVYRSAINQCRKLKTIIFQQSNQLIEFGLYVFSVLDSIEEIVLPSSTKFIPASEFFHLKFNSKANYLLWKR